MTNKQEGSVVLILRIYQSNEDKSLYFSSFNELSLLNLWTNH